MPLAAYESGTRSPTHEPCVAACGSVRLPIFEFHTSSAALTFDHTFGDTRQHSRAYLRLLHRQTLERWR